MTWNPGASVATGAVAVGVGLMLCLPMVGVVNSVQTVTTVDDAQALVSGPLTPCRNRTALLEQVVAVAPPDQLSDLIVAAQSIDLRCPGLASDLGRAAIVAGDLVQGRSLAEFSTVTDPYLSRGWLLMANVAAEQGNPEEALLFLDEAQLVNDASPDPLISESILVLRERLGDKA